MFVLAGRPLSVASLGRWCSLLVADAFAAQVSHKGLSGPYMRGFVCVCREGSQLALDPVPGRSLRPAGYSLRSGPDQTLTPSDTRQTPVLARC